MKHFRISAFALFVAALSTPALAQDGSETAANRTPVRAQQFLAAMPPTMVAAKDQLSMVKSAESTDVCKTVFAVQQAKTVGGTQFVIDDTKREEQIVLDWSDVETVSVGGTTFALINLITSHSAFSKQWTLYFASPDTRDRSYAAAQYLRTACDKTKELGF